MNTDKNVMVKFQFKNKFKSFDSGNLSEKERCKLSQINQVIMYLETPKF